MRGAFRIGISQFRVGKKRFQRAVTRELSAANHLHLRGVERQKQDVFEIVVVVRFAHRREIDHFWQALFQFIGVAVQSDQRCVARFDQVIVLVRRETNVERL